MKKDNETKKLTVEIPIDVYDEMHSYCTRYSCGTYKDITYKRFIVLAIEFYIYSHL